LVSLSLHMVIETSSEPITGWIEAPAAERRLFTGWLEMTAVVADAVNRSRRVPTQPMSAKGSPTGDVASE